VLECRVNPNLARSWSHGTHRLPIRWGKALLKPIQLIARSLACDRRERTNIVRRGAGPNDQLHGAPKYANSCITTSTEAYCGHAPRPRSMPELVFSVAATRVNIPLPRGRSRPGVMAVSQAITASSLSITARRASLRLERRMTFEIVSEVERIETIAVRCGIRELARLRARYGHGQWRKLKGVATVRFSAGRTARAELHWYEAHGIGRVGVKIKALLD